MDANQFQPAKKPSLELAWTFVVEVASSICRRLGQRDSDFARDVAASVGARLEVVLSHSPTDWKAYLYKTVQNAALDALPLARRRAEARVLSEAAISEEAAAPEISEFDVSDRTRLVEWIDTLPPRYRAVMRLRFEGKAPREIAKELNLKPGRTRVQLHRGLLMLRQAAQDGPISGSTKVLPVRDLASNVLPGPPLSTEERRALALGLLDAGYTSTRAAAILAEKGIEVTPGQIRQWKSRWLSKRRASFG